MGIVRNILFSIFFVAFVQMVFCEEAAAQDKKGDVIQFSGVVATQDTLMGILGAHVYVPKGGRGTTTNYYGYFSFPVLEGDSVVISVVGYQKTSIIIPQIDEDSYTAIIPLLEDTTYLPDLEVLLFPTEEIFKDAVLAYRLPYQGDINNMDNNLNAMTMAEMAKVMPMDGSMNHKYFMQQQAIYLHDGYGPRYNPLFNPFAWAEFFKSLKKKKN